MVFKGMEHYFVIGDYGFLSAWRQAGAVALIYDPAKPQQEKYMSWGAFQRVIRESSDELLQASLLINDCKQVHDVQIEVLEELAFRAYKTANPTATQPPVTGKTPSQRKEQEDYERAEREEHVS